LYTKITHFPVFAQKNLQTMDEVEVFFDTFKILEYLHVVSGMGWYAQKISKSLHPSEK
jgi:hypothetical protein